MWLLPALLYSCLSKKESAFRLFQRVPVSFSLERSDRCASCPEECAETTEMVERAAQREPDNIGVWRLQGVVALKAT